MAADWQSESVGGDAFGAGGRKIASGWTVIWGAEAVTADEVECGVVAARAAPPMADSVAVAATVATASAGNRAVRTVQA